MCPPGISCNKKVLHDFTKPHEVDNTQIYTFMENVYRFQINNTLLHTGDLSYVLACGHAFISGFYNTISLAKKFLVVYTYIYEVLIRKKSTSLITQTIFKVKSIFFIFSLCILCYLTNEVGMQMAKFRPIGLRLSRNTL